MPDEISFVVTVAWKGEEEWRTIETVLFAKLCKLFRSRLLAKDGDCRIAGDKLDQQCHERDDGPNNQQQNQQSSEDAEDPVPKRWFALRRIYRIFTGFSGFSQIYKDST